MQEMIDKVAAHAGINPEQAQKAVHAAVEFIKDKLPAGMGQHLDGLLSGRAGAGGGMPDLSEIAGKLGGLLGGGEKK